MTISQAYALAVQHHQAGRLAEAEAIYRQILAVAPQHAGALHLLGVLAHQVGRSELAVELIGQASALSPQDPEMHSNLGEAFRKLGQWDEAITAYRRAIELRPDSAEAQSNLGSVLAKKDQLEEAIGAYRRAIELRPDLAEAHNNLGNALARQGRLDEAIASFRRVLELRADFADTHNNLGNALAQQGRLDEAIASIRRAIELRPDFAGAFNNLGNALAQQGRFAVAIASFRQAIELQPTFADIHNNLGSALQGSGQLDEAIAAYGQAIALTPDLAEAHNNLGNALREKGKLDDAIASFRRALELDPTSALAHSNLGNILLSQGRADEAIACYRRAIDLPPHAAFIHSNFLAALHYGSETTPPVLLEAHGEYDRRHAAPLRGAWSDHPNPPNPERRLRVGYVSPDFRHNVVGHFLMPLLEAHDHTQFEVHCYASVDRPDAITERFMKLADVWRDVRGLGDEALAAQIREDRIDILVDLSQHMRGNRLLVFARKPAPVQVAWLGHPWSTGLQAIDYRLTDASMEPEGSAWSESVEAPVRLPDSWFCYDPIDEYPEPCELPALRSGHVTFGCLNSFSRVNEAVLQRWIRVMRSVEGSRLMLRCPAGETQARVRRWFEAQGIGAERLELVGWAGSRGDYLRFFERMDIALDPSLYNGGTTTCDTLWMGVPVLTLPGEMVVARIGLSILSAAGLSEFVAHSEAEYLRLAVSLAGDLPRLAGLRATLRDRMKASAFMDGPRFARNVEAAYRQMWRTWCNHRSSRLPEMTLPQAFNVAAQPPRVGRLAEQDQSDESVADSRQSPQLQPENASGHLALGNALAHQGRIEEAMAAYRRALELQPDYAEAHNNLGKLLSDQGQLGGAIAAYRQALQLKPDFAWALYNLGNALLSADQLSEAIIAYRQALRLMPDFAWTHYNLGNALVGTDQLDEAIHCYRRAVELQPDHAEARSNLGYALSSQGRIEEATAAYESARRLRPDLAWIHSNALLHRHYRNDLDAESSFQEHRRWSEIHAEPLAKEIEPHRNNPNPNRRLRIGYLSADFREHSGAYFFENLLASHDRGQVEVFCYAHLRRADSVTARLREKAGHWRDITGLSDARAAALVRQDEIDLLVDLAGHTAQNRLLIFARRPAPVQVTYLGYCDTTGMKMMNYRLTDAQADPPGATEHLHTECLVRLPEMFACFRPAEAAPAVGLLPALSRGRITFASFHALSKLNDRLLENWARILHRVPGSRLLLVAAGLGEASCRHRLSEFFGRQGIRSERLEFKGRLPVAEYLALHQEADVLLDSHPFSGHTVSCHALWMGVPVVTMAGDRHCSRMVASVLSNVGLPELIARTPEQYVEIAATLAADLPRLAALRASLRERMAASPLMDGSRFAGHVEQAYRQMWRTWCSKKPALPPT